MLIPNAIILFFTSIITCLSQSPQTQLPLTFSQGSYQLTFLGPSYTAGPFSLLIDLTTPYTVIMYSPYGAPCLAFTTITGNASNQTCGNLSASVVFPLYRLEFGNCQEPIHLYIDSDSDYDSLSILPEWGDCQLSDNFLDSDSDFGKGTYGTVGFGYNYANGQNYILSPEYSIMAIYLNQTTRNGFMELGGANFTYATTKTPLYSFSTNSSASTTATGVYVGSPYINSIQFGDFSIPVPDYSVIVWDLNCPGICVSPYIYQQVTNAVEDQYYCSQGKTIVCENIFQNASSWPSWQISAGGQTITLPPQTYIQDYQYHLQDNTNTTFTFNINANIYNTSYSFVNTTIFGVGVMAYYYTVFNTTNQTIDLYLAVDNLPTPQTSIQPIDDNPTNNTQSTSQNTTQDPARNTSQSSFPNSTQNQTQSSSANTSNNASQNNTEAPTENTTQNTSQSSTPNSTQNQTHNSSDIPNTPKNTNDPQNSTLNSTQTTTQSPSQNTSKDTQQNSTEYSPQQTQTSPIGDNPSSSRSSKVNAVVWIVPVVIICVLVVCYLAYRKYKKGKVVDLDPPPYDPNPIVMPQYIDRSHLPMPSR